MQKIEVIGNLGNDPEMRFTPDGIPVTSFNIACNSKRKIDKVVKEETTWYRINTFDKLAENCNQILSKGWMVFVSGLPKIDSWIGKDGMHHYQIQIIAREVVFIKKSETPKVNTEKDTNTKEISVSATV